MEMQLTGWKANSQTSFKGFFSGKATAKEVNKPTTTLVSGNIRDEDEVKKDERRFID